MSSYCRNKRSRGSFYVPARFVHLDLPCVVERSDGEDQLRPLFEADDAFRRKLRGHENEVLYSAFAGQIFNYRNPEYREAFVWSKETREIATALQNRAQFALQQWERYKRNLQWIPMEVRAALLWQVNYTVYSTLGYLLFFEEFHDGIGQLANDLRVILQVEVDVSVPVRFVIDPH